MRWQEGRHLVTTSKTRRHFYGLEVAGVRGNCACVQISILSPKKFTMLNLSMKLACQNTLEALRKISQIFNLIMFLSLQASAFFYNWIE